MSGPDPALMQSTFREVLALCGVTDSERVAVLSEGDLAQDGELLRQGAAAARRVEHLPAGTELRIEEALEREGPARVVLRALLSDADRRSGMRHALESRPVRDAAATLAEIVLGIAGDRQSA